VSESSSIQFDLVIEPINGLFEKSSELNIYRLLQESISNILRHSRASEAKVIVAREDGCVHLTVADNGCGMADGPSPKKAEPRAGLGHQSLRERVRILGASMEIQTAKGQGTTLSFRIPLSEHPLSTTLPESNNGHR
jgi:signal transduction histidine kinase